MPRIEYRADIIELSIEQGCQMDGSTSLKFEIKIEGSIANSQKSEI